MNTLLSVDAYTWSEILWITLISILLVFLMLILLVYIMKLFGIVFSHKTQKATATEGQPAAKPQMISSEEVAAIATALKLYKGVLHDKESDVLTILNIKRVYSPWNSKIHGLTQLPQRNK